MYSFSLWIDLTGRLFAESNNCNYQFVNSEVSLGFFKIGHTHFFRLFNTVDNVQYNFFADDWIQTRTSGIGSDHSTN